MTTTATTTSLSEGNEARRERIDAALAAALAAERERIEPRLWEAMQYSLCGGGKRIRPLLLLAATDAAGGDEAAALPFACAIEMIHAYSLVHDDLPAMDDDRLRRGRPTSHVVFGEAMAILAGDALLTEAFAHATTRALAGGLPAGRALEALAELATAAGAAGMVGGQAADVLEEGRPVGYERVESIHRRKTGALLRAAVRIGALVAGLRAAPLAQLTAYGECLGLAFQIADDLLDETASTGTTGKSEGRDRERGKATAVARLGIDGARAELVRLHGRATDALADFGERATGLREIAALVVTRAGVETGP